MKPTRSAPRLALLLIALPWLAVGLGCSLMTGTNAQTTVAPGTTPTAEAASSAWDGFCAVAKPLGWSRDDTPETVVEIKQHNALGAAHCGWPQ